MHSARQAGTQANEYGVIRLTRFVPLIDFGTRLWIDQFSPVVEVEGSIMVLL
jgi:hypothetical protein